jgi:hypothetical protein
VTKQISLALILGAPVLAAGSRVGIVSDVYVDPVAEYLVGLQVTGPNERRWFLPWVAATLEKGNVLAASPLVFMPSDQLDFYVRHGAKVAQADAGAVLVDGDGRLTRASENSSVSDLLGEGSPVA